MKNINLLSLDLELNQPSNTIIQVGCVIGNLQTGEILETYLANVYTQEIIAPQITKLTNITQKDTDEYNGLQLFNIYQDLKCLHLNYKCFRNCLTWGGGDSELLRQQLKLDNETFLFGRRWIDAKTLFVSRAFAQNMQTQAGLAKAMTKMGLKFVGTKHNAKDDALNTFIIYRELLKYYEVNNGTI